MDQLLQAPRTEEEIQELIDELLEAESKVSIVLIMLEFATLIRDSKYLPDF